MFPQDVMENIFYWLPAKAVGRSRCVSKHWRYLLSQPEFIRNHLKRTKTLPRNEESLILVSKDRDSLYTTQLNHTSSQITIVAKKLFDFDDEWLPSIEISRIISCDGLVLVGGNGNWFLLNPTTRELKELPRSPYALTMFNMCGLGYDSVSDDYKIVAITYQMVDIYKEVFVNLYSVRNGTWKKVECSPHHQSFGDIYLSAETINGCIHWIATATVDSPFVIAAFDFAEERFREVPPPSSFDSSKFGINYGVAILKGCLCVFREMSENYESDVWMMKEYGVQDSWTKFTIIDSEESELKLLCMLGKDQLVILKGGNCDDQKLVMYNLEEESFKDFVGAGSNGDGIYAGGTCTFIESLISPHCVI